MGPSGGRTSYQDATVDSEKINRWLTLLANIGVVAGIVFLAIEIRQNQAILEESNQYNFLEMRAISLESYNDFRALVVQDAELSRIWSDGRAGVELSALDEARFRTLCTSSVCLAVTQFERGAILGDGTVEGQVTLTANRLAQYPGYQRCWENNRENVQAYGLGLFVEEVEREFQSRHN